MTHYEVLGVATTAGDGEVRRAYLDQARRHHPDTGGDATAMTAVNEAWSVLSDPARRRRYDHELGIGRAAAASAPEPEAETEAETEATFDPDLLDDRPMTAARPRGLLPLLPPTLFLGSVAVGCVALVLDAPAVLGAAATLFLLSCVAVAAVALLTLRGAVRR